MRWLEGITESMDMMNLGQTPLDGEGQGSLACCSPWGHKELPLQGGGKVPAKSAVFGGGREVCPAPRRR